MKPKFRDLHRYPNGYTPAVETDLKTTFRRIQRENAAKAEREAANKAEADAKVKPLKTGTA